MNVILKKGGKTKERDYPRKDIIEPLEGINAIKGVPLDPAHEDYETWYYIRENKIENTHPEIYNMKYQDELTDKNDKEYKHLKICNRNWYLEKKPDTEIIENLNVKLGSYLDSLCPEWERLKYQTRLQLGTKSEEHKYYKAVLQWLDDCRAARDNKEAALLSKTELNIDFNSWPKKPQKVNFKN